MTYVYTSSGMFYWHSCSIDSHAVLQCQMFHDWHNPGKIDSHAVLQCEMFHDWHNPGKLYFPAFPGVISRQLCRLSFLKICTSRMFWLLNYWTSSLVNSFEKMCRHSVQCVSVGIKRMALLMNNLCVQSVPAFFNQQHCNFPFFQLLFT
jgi:hypothetical protein